MGVEAPGVGRPLDGLEIVELASFVAAPLGGMTLGQLGADVVRIDLPGGNADIGRWPLAASGLSMYWAGLNKGKRSVCIDWRTDKGAELVAQLIRTSGPDGGIVLTNVLQRGALSFAALSTTRPDLIYVHIKGRHDGGSAVDYTVNAAVGFPAITGFDVNARPVNHVLPAWDIACGLYAALAIVGAERQRRFVESAQNISLALEDVALAMAGNLGFLAEAEVNRENRKPSNNEVYGTFGRDFVSADGVRFMVVALTDRQWRDLLEASDLQDVVAGLGASLGVDFRIDGERFRHRDILFALVQLWFSQRTAGDIVEALAGRSVVWSKYRTFIDLLEESEPAFFENPMMTRLDQHGIGEHWATGSPIIWAGEKQAMSPAPKLGQDTQDALAERLQLSKREIARLLDQGIVA